MLYMEAGMVQTTEILEKPAKTPAKKGKAGGAGADRKAQAELSLAERRKARRGRIARANKITFILETEVRKFMASEARGAGMDIAPFMQKVAENHVMATAPEGHPLAERLRAKRAVLDRAVALAREIDEAGGFDEHLIRNVMRKAAAEPEFRTLYDRAVNAGEDDPKTVARAKVPLNQQLGRLIKRAAGAKSKRDETGKIQRAQVQGEMLSAYTLLEKPS